MGRARVNPATMRERTMRGFSRWLAAGLGLAVALTLASAAEAAGPVRKGTISLSAERLAGIGARVDDPNAAFYAAILTTTATQSPVTTLQYPRLGFDYFIIDGLSLGGNAGFGFHSAGGGNVASIAFIPRVGYAFDITRSLLFWPRGGVGFHLVDDANPGSFSTALLSLEGAFLLKIVPHAFFEFGPYFDIAFARPFPIELGATAGLAIQF